MYDRWQSILIANEMLFNNSNITEMDKFTMNEAMSKSSFGYWQTQITSGRDGLEKIVRPPSHT